MSTGTVHGTSIPLRELTEEECNLEVTWQRFRDYHLAIGEDFLDQTGEGNHLIFGGYLLAKYPQYKDDILSICNNRYGESQNFREVLGYDNLYIEFAEFVNLTGALKKRVNQILIQVTEYYNT